MPAYRDTGIAEEHVLLGRLVDLDDRTVEFYKRIGEPLQWYLRWPLWNGAIYTHLREEDGEEMAEVTVEDLSIVENELTDTPYLLPDGPLAPEISATPGFQEWPRSSPRSGEPGGAWVCSAPASCALDK